MYSSTFKSNKILCANFSEAILSQFKIQRFKTLKKWFHLFCKPVFFPDKKFSQEFKAANISLTHSVFFAKKTSKLAKFLFKMQIYSVNPVLLSSLQSRRSPNYNCDQPSLCIGGFYWQQGGLPSAALVRGIWGRMDRGAESGG